MDYYPNEFSAQARARNEAERLKSKQEFQRRRSEKLPPEWKKTSREWDLNGFYDYILRVFLAYTHEACEVARQGLWTVDRISSMADEFLRRFTINAYYEDGHDRSGEKFPDVTGSNLNGSLRSDLMRFFRNTKQWQEYEAEVLAVAEELADRGRAAELDLGGGNGSPSQADHGPVSDQPASGKADDPEFRWLADQNPHIEAFWDALQIRWILRDRPLQPNGKPNLYQSIVASPEVMRAAKEAARIAVSRLRQSRSPEVRALVSTLREPLYVWLDLMRSNQRGFRLIPQLRDWRGGRSAAQFHETGIAPSNVRITGNGLIPAFFQESAAFWEDLVAVGFEPETAPASVPDDAAVTASGSAKPVSPEAEHSLQTAPAFNESGSDAPGPGMDAVDPKREEPPPLNVSLIEAWIEAEGWINKTLAQKLKISERAVSSIRNNGSYHGAEAVTKLANLIGS
jgi:hypothetical protein